MIKVEIYFGSFSLENEEPDMILSLKEFQDKYNRGDDDAHDAYYIKFVLL